MLHLQQGLMPGYQGQNLDHFTGPNGHLGSFNRFELGVLIPTITKNYTSSIANSGAELTLSPQTNNVLFGDSDSSCGIEFSTGYHLEDDSDVSSPPLWKTSPLTTPTTIASPLQHLHRGSMEMIQSVPESSQELSLKDLAELPAPTWKTRGLKGEAIREENMKKMKRRRDERRASRNKSMDSRDFLLKMFLPAALGPKKRNFGNGPRSKLLPRPQDQMEKSVDSEWWKKRFSSSRESVNNRNSSSSSSHDSSTRRYVGGFLPGCWPFFYTNKSKATGHTGCFI